MLAAFAHATSVFPCAICPWAGRRIRGSIDGLPVDIVGSDADRAELIARRESLKARIERDRRLQLVQSIVDILNELGIAYTVDTESQCGCLASWPVVGSQIDWASVPGATWIGAASDTERDLAVRSLLTRLSDPQDQVSIISSNGDAPIVNVRSGDLIGTCGSILSSQPSLYLATADEDWLIEHVKGRGLWGGVAPKIAGSVRDS